MIATDVPIVHFAQVPICRGNRKSKVVLHIDAKRVNQDLFGGNCEAAAGKFLGCFVEIRSGRSTI
jgi:hypothetical protein